MDDPLGDSLRVIAALNEAGVAYVVVGGVAMNAHGLVRATEDLDLFVRGERDNIERLKAALRSVWDDPNIAEISADDLMGEYPAVRYGPPEGALYLDILTRLGEFATYDDLDVETVAIGDVPVRVATPQTLLWMKSGTVRPIDRADADALRQTFGLTDAEKP